MALLQVPQPTFYSSSLLERSARWAALSSSWSGDRCSPDAISRSLIVGRKRRSGQKLGSVLAMADPSIYKMNLNEYMVTLEKPLGLRFALSVDGKIFVHSLRRGVFHLVTGLFTAYHVDRRSAGHLSSLHQDPSANAKAQVSNPANRATCSAELTGLLKLGSSFAKPVDFLWDSAT